MKNYYAAFCMLGRILGIVSIVNGPIIPIDINSFDINYLEELNHD